MALYGGDVRYILVGMSGKHVSKPANKIELRFALDIGPEYANSRLLLSITRFAYMINDQSWKWDHYGRWRVWIFIRHGLSFAVSHVESPCVSVLDVTYVYVACTSLDITSYKIQNVFYIWRVTFSSAGILNKSISIALHVLYHLCLVYGWLISLLDNRKCDLGDWKFIG